MSPEQQAERVDAAAKACLRQAPDWSVDWKSARESTRQFFRDDAIEVLAAADRAVPVVSEEEYERRRFDYDLALTAVRAASARAERAEEAYERLRDAADAVVFFADTNEMAAALGMLQSMLPTPGVS